MPLPLLKVSILQLTVVQASAFTESKEDNIDFAIGWKDSGEDHVVEFILDSNAKVVDIRPDTNGFQRM